MTTNNARQPEFPPLRDTQRRDEPRRKNCHIHWRLTNVVAVRPQKGPPLESLSRRYNGGNENIAQRRPKAYSEVCGRAQTPQDHRRQHRTDTAHLVRSQNSERDPDNRRRNVQSTKEQNRDSRTERRESLCLRKRPASIGKDSSPDPEQPRNPEDSPGRRRCAELEHAE